MSLLKGADREVSRRDWSEDHMAFFLIGRGPGNGVRVLSGTLFETRQDAMAELSRLSSLPPTILDADVFVADLDAGAPVLLVRPQAAAADEPTAVVPGAAAPSIEEPSARSRLQPSGLMDRRSVYAAAGGGRRDSERRAR